MKMREVEERGEVQKLLEIEVDRNTNGSTQAYALGTDDMELNERVLPIPSSGLRSDTNKAKTMIELGGNEEKSLTDNMIENIKYGGGGGTTVYKLNVTHDQLSAHNVWIETGPPEHISMIVVGWMVHREITPGYPAEPTSTYGGAQYELLIHIEQDRNIGNWWLIVSDHKVGYWPKELFPYLRNGSLHIAWGGIGIAGSNGFCPPMGSGHMPDGVYEHATVFRALHWVRSDGKFLPPSDKTTEWVDRSNVYGLMNHHHFGKYRSGYMISIGGPGGYCRV
ncbi:uncharacterized protein LOC130137893 [Syzygium oleosum]|uniref:uncharacterized protein LOC130137893 n=1 Tax=Syzygium oleosum TaxID=219896 RepID=UPI0024BA7D90|nr:uncharacterized protein LOC130137893 [Syzygium oleosum]